MNFHFFKLFHFLNICNIILPISKLWWKLIQLFLQTPFSLSFCFVTFILLFVRIWNLNLLYFPLRCFCSSCVFFIFVAFSFVYWHTWATNDIEAPSKATKNSTSFLSFSHICVQPVASITFVSVSVSFGLFAGVFVQVSDKIR